MSQLVSKYQDLDGNVHEAIRGRVSTKCGFMIEERRGSHRFLMPTNDSARCDCLECLAWIPSPPISGSKLNRLPMQNIPRSKKR